MSWTAERSAWVSETHTSRLRWLLFEVSLGIMELTAGAVRGPWGNEGAGRRCFSSIGGCWTNTAAHQSHAASRRPRLLHTGTYPELKCWVMSTGVMAGGDKEQKGNAGGDKEDNSSNCQRFLKVLYSPSFQVFSLFVVLEEQQLHTVKADQRSQIFRNSTFLKFCSRSF